MWDFTIRIFMRKNFLFKITVHFVCIRLTSLYASAVRIRTYLHSIGILHKSHIYRYTHFSQSGVNIKRTVLSSSKRFLFFNYSLYASQLSIPCFLKLIRTAIFKLMVILLFSHFNLWFQFKFSWKPIVSKTTFLVLCLTINAASLWNWWG